jgi:hypothetical protein
MTEGKSSANIETHTLSHLRALEQSGLAYVQKCPVGSAPAEMAHFLAGLDPIAWAAQQLAPIAEWLKSQGRPQVSSEFNFFLRDLSTARQQWIGMYRGVLQTQRTIADIWSGANQTAVENILAATAYSNAVFNKWQTDMFDIMERRCFLCHSIIDIPGGGHCWECARVLRLI